MNDEENKYLIKFNIETQYVDNKLLYATFDFDNDCYSLPRSRPENRMFHTELLANDSISITEIKTKLWEETKEPRFEELMKDVIYKFYYNYKYISYLNKEILDEIRNICYSLRYPPKIKNYLKWFKGEQENHERELLLNKLKYHAKT